MKKIRNRQKWYDILCEEIDERGICCDIEIKNNEIEIATTMSYATDVQKLMSDLDIDYFETSGESVYGNDEYFYI